MVAYSAKEKRDEAHRENGYRKRVYARMVAEGRMKAAHAERAIAIMAEIEADYAALAEAEAAKTRLI